MPSSSQPPVRSRFARAVEALCLSRQDIARALDLTPEALDAYTSERLPVPPMVQLALVELLKAHEAMIGGAAGSLYDEAMYRLERSGLARPVAPNDAEPQSPPPSPPPPLSLSSPPLSPPPVAGGGSAA
jgi:hypothetical protein